MNTYIKPILLPTLIAFGMSLSACSEAQSADDVKAVAAEAQSGNWDIQTEASHIHFSALQEGDRFTGEFENFSGLIKFDPEVPEDGFVKITIPLKDVDAGSNDRNSTLPDKIWFSAKAFPTAIYTSSDISAEGTGYIAKGELTLKGVSVPFDLPFTLDVDGETALMTSQVDMDRTLWGVGAAPWDTDEWVSRTVTLDIKVTAKKIE